MRSSNMQSFRFAYHLSQYLYSPGANSVLAGVHLNNSVYKPNNYIMWGLLPDSKRVLRFYRNLPALSLVPPVPSATGSFTQSLCCTHVPMGKKHSWYELGAPS